MAVSVRAALKRWREDTTAQDDTPRKSRKLNHEQRAACVHEPQLTKGLPRLSVDVSPSRSPVTHAQLGQLLWFASLGKSCGAKQPSWCRFHHQKQLSGVHVSVLRGVGQHHFYSHYLRFKTLRRTFSTRFSLPPPPPDFLSAVLSADTDRAAQSSCRSAWENPAGRTADAAAEAVPVDSEPSSVADLVNSPIVRAYGTEKRGLSGYVLSAADMSKHGFPLKGAPGCERFVSTCCTDSVTDSSPLFGLDCEMCQTKFGKELTRVSLVDAEGRCLMDELVKPYSRIYSYCTRFSGITKAMLQPVTTRLPDVQAQLRNLLPPDAVLVGHSLEHDLQALQMIHQHVIDTSLLFPREFGQKIKLKTLADAVLHRTIQSEERIGHHPTEDAVAALELAQYFINHGPKQVAEVMLEYWRRQISSPPLNNPSELTNGPDSGLPTQPSLPAALRAAGLAAVHIVGVGGGGAEPWAKEGQRTTCGSDREVLSTSCRRVPSSFFSLVQFSSLAESPEPLHGQMRARLTAMCTVFAGPFLRGVALKSVRKWLRTCGPIRSMRLLRGTDRPHVEVQYSTLEGARLALSSLDGQERDGLCVRVQRPVTELTLEAEALLQELEAEPAQQRALYVSGFSRHHSEQDLRLAFLPFGPVEAVELPRMSSGKSRRYAFIRFQLDQSVSSALLSPLQLLGPVVRKCRALTPAHVRSWSPRSPPAPDGSCQTADYSWTAPPPDRDVRDAIRKLDRRVGKLYETLPSGTLCLVLLPGQTSASGDSPGLCMVGIKDRPAKNPEPLV